uniref:Glycine rich superfamily member n=1 Tax=Rhipicephalus appendiculatus TaxID=34631 RepID=A0A131Z3W5_RHIAP
MNTFLVSVLLYTAPFVRAQDKAGPRNDPVTATGFPLDYRLHGPTSGLHTLSFSDNAFGKGLSSGNSFEDSSLRAGALHSVGGHGEVTGGISYRGDLANSVTPSFASGSASGGSWTDRGSTSRGIPGDVLGRNPFTVSSLSHGRGSSPIGTFGRADRRLRGHSGVSSWLESPLRSSSRDVRFESTSSPLRTIRSVGGDLPSISRGGWADSTSRRSSIGNSGAIGFGIGRVANYILGSAAQSGGSASTRFLHVLRRHSSLDTSTSRNSLSSGLLAAVSGGLGLHDNGRFRGDAAGSHIGGIPWTGALRELSRRGGAFRAPGNLANNGVAGDRPNAGVHSFPWTSRVGAAAPFLRGTTGFPDEQAWRFNPRAHIARYFGNTSGSYPGLSNYNYGNAAGVSGRRIWQQRKLRLV